ncbi:hypothetical protein EYF80_026759 [Liparis tanakae]|uniref:Uncharacterized protein n=1 Tax=Liparis tanakae TaxID=230148 RepID=A0A4Z2HBM8_9TELE|nr:hypothetical protein EYF80_026759 [Liparis tanakae]
MRPTNTNSRGQRSEVRGQGSEPAEARGTEEGKQTEARTTTRRSECGGQSGGNETAMEEEEERTPALAEASRCIDGFSCWLTNLPALKGPKETLKDPVKNQLRNAPVPICLYDKRRQRERERERQRERERERESR